MNVEQGMSKLIDTVKVLGERVTALEGRLRCSAALISLDKEHDRIMERMKTISGTYSGHQSWSASDVYEFNKLRERRDEIRKILGVKY